MNFIGNLSNTFEFQHMKNMPKQTNSEDCGVFICQYAEYLSHNAPFNFTQKDMMYFRRRMVLEIVQESILKPAKKKPSRGSNSYIRSHAHSSSLDLNNIQGVHLRPPLSPHIDPSVPTTRLTNDCQALQCKIQEYHEKNSVVACTNNELHQEVSDALEERIALEYQLEQLKSFGDE